jgi:hypothetical protein
VIEPPYKITPGYLAARAGLLCEQTGIEVVPLHCSHEELAKHGWKAEDLESLIMARMSEREITDLLGSDKPKGIVSLVYFDHYRAPRLFELSAEDSEDYRTFARASCSFGEMAKHWFL